VSHLPRERFTGGAEVLVTLAFQPGLPDLRRRPSRALVAEALAASAGRFGMHVLVPEPRRDHLHLLVRVRSPRALSRGMKALSVRISRGLNRVWGRHGPVFSDRFETRVLHTSAEREGARRDPCSWRSDPGPTRPTGCDVRRRPARTG